MVGTINPAPHTTGQHSSKTTLNQNWAQVAAFLNDPATGGVRRRLTADTTFYFGTGGSDSSTDGTTTATRFATVQGALNYLHANVDRAGNQIILQIAGGTGQTITTPITLLSVIGGVEAGYATRELTIRGDTTNLGASAGGYTIDTSATNTPTFTAVGVVDGWVVEGFEIKSHTSSQSFLADFGAVIFPGKNKYGSAGIRFLAEYAGSRIEIIDNYEVTVAALVEYRAIKGGQILGVGGKTFTFTGSLAYTIFADAYDGGQVQMTGVTFSAASVTGQRWVRDELSIVNFGGIDAATLNTNVPGNAVGATTALPIDRGGSGRTTITPQLGGDVVMVNGTLVATVGSSALTIALKTSSGGDPSTSDPVYVAFRSATAATGDYTVLTVTAATSIVVSSGSTLGAANSVPFRIWVVAFNDAGTFRLGVINCTVGGSSPTQIVGLDEYSVKSSTAEGGAGAADSAGVFYTGTAVSSKGFRILGFAEYAAGLATAGTWASVPTRLQLFGPGVKRPGEVVQVIHGSSATSTTTSSATYQTTNLSAAITPTSSANLIKAAATGIARTDSASTAAQVQIHRGSTAVGSVGQAFSVAAPAWNTPALVVLDAPGTSGALTYAVKLKSTDGANPVFFLKGDVDQAGRIIAEEIMV